MNLLKRLLVFLLLIVILSFCACSSNSLETDIYKVISNKWEEVNTFDDNSYISNLNEKTSFEIESIEKENDIYTVTLDVIAPDISSKVEEYQNSITSIPSEDEMNEKLKSIIDSSELKTTQQTVTVFVIDDGTYDVEFSSGFADAMCGYSYQYYVNQMQKLYKGE